MIRVLVVDDHDLVRTGIARMLNDEEGVEVVGEASNGEEAVVEARKLRPDVVLMDVKMPGMNGIEATKKIVKSLPDVRVLVLTVCEDEPFPSRLMRAGAAGYLTKGAELEEMLRAVRAVSMGQRYISADIARALALQPFDERGQSPFYKLSERELQIAIMVVNCQKVQTIAEALRVSPKTVNTYRYRIFEKLGLSSDVELTHLASKHGLVDDDVAME